MPTSPDDLRTDDLHHDLQDGSAGLRAGAPGLPRQDEAWWEEYRDRLEDASGQAG